MTKKSKMALLRSKLIHDCRLLLSQQIIIRPCSVRFSSNSGVNFKLYPLDKPQSQEYGQLVKKGVEMLKNTGCATFPSFMSIDATHEAAVNAQRASKDAFVTDDVHNAYQLPGFDELLPAGHVRNLGMNTQVASVAFDEMETSSPLRRLYSYDGLVEFIGQVVGQKLHRLSDPLGACTVNIFRPGWEHAWHFDESEFTITLCLQQSDGGGHFEYSTPLRTSQDDLAVTEVAHILSNHSEYSPFVDESNKGQATATISQANFKPGTLQIFAGRYSLHRVTKIETSSDKERLVAVLCFATEPGVVNSASVQKMFWGRTSDEIINWSK